MVEATKSDFSLPFTACQKVFPSERLFSAAGNLVAEKWNCLLPENVDRMLFLFENLNEEPLLEDEGSDDEELGEAED